MTDEESQDHDEIRECVRLLAARVSELEKVKPAARKPIPKLQPRVSFPQGFNTAGNEQTSEMQRVVKELWDENTTVHRLNKLEPAAQRKANRTGKYDTLRELQSELRVAREDVKRLDAEFHELCRKERGQSGGETDNT